MLEQKKHIKLSKRDTLKVVFKKDYQPEGIEAKVTAYSYFYKHLFDFIVALVGIIILSPLYTLLYFITISTSKGPGLYNQKRIGLNGKPFYIFKFRSMKVDAENSGPKLTFENDERITKWGAFMRKYYLDELPQLLNVLKGDMSLVGPRPERPFFIKQIQERDGDFISLLQFKPGITSLGQIRFGYAHNVEQMMQRLKYEQLYLKNISAKTDFKILLSTISSVVKAKGK